MQAVSAMSTLDMSRDQWLNARRSGLGGSDAAAIVGLDKYSTPYTVWADKTGKLPEQPENERMRLGKHLEPYLATRFTELTGKRVRRRNAVLTSLKYPWALANIDYEVVGEKAGLEIKTTNILNLRQYKGGEYPDNFYAQCCHYMAVTGYQKWYLIVLVLGSADKPYIYEIERDEDEIKALMDAEEAFWNNHVLADVPPPVDGSEPTSAALPKVYPGGDATELIINQDHVLASLVDVKAQIKALEDQKTKLEQIVKADMGNHELARSGPYNITWRSGVRNNIDGAAILRDHPRINATRYTKPTPTRTFTVKEDKQNG
ncbi:MAG: YqaJ viral recombinase family protein [Coriobacteriia bacterium]|nr:YqaJ viral recombinase family protein [Coriobacteriia bacterium]